jgi:tryptophanyl-tRNA synthetase
MDIVLSGIRSTGNLHLGNYFGALRNFVRMQTKYKCFFFIADLHALTTHPKSADFAANVTSILAQYIAAGLDPQLCALFVQSDVPEVSQMYAMLNMLAYVGELQRTASFKDKVRHQPDNVNAGLLTYPVLMAADILLHRARYVPVGKDQEQHLEYARTLARRFNKLYGEDIFPLPWAYNFDGDLIKIPGLDGSGKMGKSEGNALYLIDDEATIRHKVRRAVTDTGGGDGVMSDAVQNLFTILKAVSDAEVVDFYQKAHAAGTIRYGDLKNQLADDICRITLPIRERALDIIKDKEGLSRIRAIGAAKARGSAAATLSEMMRIMGF